VQITDIYAVTLKCDRGFGTDMLLVVLSNRHATGHRHLSNRHACGLLAQAPPVCGFLAHISPACGFFLGQGGGLQGSRFCMVANSFVENGVAKVRGTLRYDNLSVLTRAFIGARNRWRCVPL
jgi:hypothetical protein